MEQNCIARLPAAHWDAMGARCICWELPRRDAVGPLKSDTPRKCRNSAGTGPRPEVTVTITSARPRPSLASFHLQYGWRRGKWQINSLIN